jgi:predicted negative regulator of RcsB-dependent stress response
MVDFDTTEEQQVEALKKWWKENGLYLLAGVVIGLGGLFGWNYWKDYQQQRAMEASATFFQLQKTITAGDQNSVEEKFAQLQNRYDKTPYAEMAYLAMAAFNSAQNRPAEAEQQLSWVKSNARVNEYREIATLRLAEALNAQQKYQQALDLLNEALPAAYTSLVEEYRGDALRGLGKIKEAREAYDRALLSGGRSEYLQWKREDLGYEPLAGGEASS